MLAGHGNGDGQPHDLYAQARAARQHSQLLARQLRAARHQTRENWQAIEAAWGRSEQIRALWQAARTDPDRLRYSAYARLQSRLTSMPVIEQAKGIIMAQCGWTEEQAFAALRQTSQQGNVKVRDLAATIVARATRVASARRPAVPAAPAAPSDSEVVLPWAPTAPANASGPRHTRKAAG